MAKKRSRQLNPQPFLADDDASVASKKRSKAPKQHQAEEKLISSGMSSKILKEALTQQREIQDEAEGRDPNDSNSLVFAQGFTEAEEVQDDIDEFTGFSETQSQFGAYDEIDEEDERVLEAFLRKDAGPQCTLADIIVEKIKQKDAKAASEMRPLPKLDSSIIDLYKGVGKLLRSYTAGKIPKAFKHIPSMQLWEDVLYLTEPENWSPNALYQSTRIFASNLGAKKAERFYRLVLLPRVREDIRKNQRLHFALYQALKKSLYKPAAFFKGILFPLCESRTCNLREAVIIGSIIQKVSIPPLHSR
ncbi:bystin-like [Corylus avellana]|uniref:bystin-like n=1 Tax=Corylus avellana TaxID=13451 RepID=UPI00286C98B0|nr:bystin-like [Corylus avellana]